MITSSTGTRSIDAQPVDPAIARSWRPLIRRNAPAGHREHTIEGALMSSVTEHVEGLARTLSADLDRAGPSSTPAKAAH